jgi:hypothetical protein
VFSREVKYSSDETTLAITSSIYKLAKKGRINIYNGTVNGLRQALADNMSNVFIIEITHPVDKNLRIKFKEYVAKLREQYRGK